MRITNHRKNKKRRETFVQEKAFLLSFFCGACEEERDKKRNKKCAEGKYVAIQRRGLSRLILVATICNGQLKSGQGKRSAIRIQQSRDTTGYGAGPQTNRTSEQLCFVLFFMTETTWQIRQRTRG